MAYQSAKQNRRSMAGGSLIAPSRKSFTHQVFKPSVASTHMDSLEHSRTNMLLRESACTCTVESSEHTMMTEESQSELRPPELSNNSNQQGNTQFLLCKFFVVLIEAEEKRMTAKADFMDLRFDLESRFGRKFSPVTLFQRIDRAGKGHLSRTDVLKFLEENGFTVGQGYTQEDLKLIFKEAKTKFQPFVKLIIDSKLEHRGSFYFNERAAENDHVVRKIDTLPPKLEKAFCELLLEHIIIKKELNFFRREIKSQNGYYLLDLFKAIVFENERDPAKQIFVSDIMRFFRFNQLLIEQTRIENILFKRVVGPDRPFDYSRLHKLLTKENLESIVHNPAVQVSGMHPAHRRNTAHKRSLNERTLASLTGPPRLNPVQQCLRNRRGCCNEPNCPHSSTKVWISGPRQSCKLEGQTAHTKCFHTDHITDEELVAHLQQYLRDLLVLENELEDTRIRLVNERDFFPKLCFRTFLATDESRELMRVNEDEQGKISDGLTELEATSETIYTFIRNYSVSQIGMCSKLDLETLLAEFMQQRMSNIPFEHQTNVLKYLDFIALISPKNRDFSELMKQRQTDYDLQQHENAYISTVHAHSHKKAEAAAEETVVRMARPVFIEDAMHSNVANLLAETLLKMVLTHARNVEVTRTYEKQTKGRHETQHVLRYVPQADAQSMMIRTADVLRFVKGPTPTPKVRSRISEPKLPRGFSHHSCAKTAASTHYESMLSPNAISRRQEFNLIKSHEKEALFLSDKFGGSRMRQSELFMNTSQANAFSSFHELHADPGFAPDVLHLSKTKIDQGTRLLK